MAKAKKLPRIVDRALFDAINVDMVKDLKAEGQSKESLIGSIEEDLEALVDAIDTGREFLELYPEDQERMEFVKDIIEWAISEVDSETFLRRALRS